MPKIEFYVNGKSFETMEEAESYLKELEDAEKKKAELLAKKESRKNAIDKKFASLLSDIEKFIEDYKTPYSYVDEDDGWGIREFYFD